MKTLASFRSKLLALTLALMASVSSFAYDNTSYKSQWCDTWNVLVSNGSVYPPLEQTYRSQLAQDTLIGGQTYTVLNRYWTDEPNGKKGYMGAVRFSDDRKVYANYKGIEYLVYDFSAQIGDTLEVLRYNDASEILRCLVCDKFVDPQTNRTVITLYVYNEDAEEWIKDEFWAIKWIEGVGAEQGFFEGKPIYTPGAAATNLLCAYQGIELKYTGPLYEEYGCEYNANDPLPLYPWCNQWNILAHGYLGPQEPLYGAKTTIYQLGGDTIINHLRYQQLTRYASDDIKQTKTYVGAIRFTKNNRQYNRQNEKSAFVK